jgi:phospholipid/cholesterol/gamma-HCH transport system substrate-binding protein
MSNRGNKYKVGILVFVAFFALILSLLSLGITKYFRETYEFMTMVNSSVQGLEKGAKVKFKGVTVGQVTKIQLDSESESNNIFIIMEFDPKAFAQNSAPTDKGIPKVFDEGELLFRKDLSKNVKKGLRCQLQYLGITGSQYIEMSYYDPEKNPVKNVKLYQDHPPYLPSIESVSVTNILAEAQDAVKKIAKINFEKISKEIEKFLVAANKLINDKDTQATMKDMQEISANLKILTARLNKTLNEKNMAEFSDKFNQTINNINSMVVSTRALVEYLEKNPESVIRGKPQRPIVEHE